MQTILYRRLTLTVCDNFGQFKNQKLSLKNWMF